MRHLDWIESFSASLMICDLKGTVLDMNARAAEMYRKDGGLELIGRNLMDCHPEPARSKLKELLESGAANVYTIEKNGIKKMIYQTPWHQKGVRAGLVELTFEIPFDLPNFVRG